MDCGKFCAVLAPMATALNPAFVMYTDWVASGRTPRDQLVWYSQELLVALVQLFTSASAGAIATRNKNGIEQHLQQSRAAVLNSPVRQSTMRRKVEPCGLVCQRGEGLIWADVSPPSDGRRKTRYSFLWLWWKLPTLPASPRGLCWLMVRFVIDIEAVAGDPEGVNILLKTERKQPTEVEETAARRLLPALRDLPRSRFPEAATEPQNPAEEEIPSHH